MKSTLIRRRLCRPAMELGICKRTHTLAAFGLLLALALASAGCNQDQDETKRSAQQMQQLQATVAQLEQRLSKLEKSSPPARSPAEERQLALHEKFNQRNEQDAKKYTPDQLDKAEQMYQAANRKYGTPESNESLKQLIEKFPDFNRTGCAVLYLAQNTKGPESEKYLQDCIEKYGNCFYGDGVQVGAYARFWLANYYSEAKQTDKAAALFREIKTLYPESIDHQGQLLVNLIK